jgi:hypothetical protein
LKRSSSLQTMRSKTFVRLYVNLGVSFLGPNPGNPPVNNPGTPINLHAENHLKLLAPSKALSKVVNVANYESSYKAPDNPPTINAEDWPKTMESIQEYL